MYDVFYNIPIDSYRSKFNAILYPLTDEIVLGYLSSKMNILSLMEIKKILKNKEV